MASDVTLGTFTQQHVCQQYSHACPPATQYQSRTGPTALHEHCLPAPQGEKPSYLSTMLKAFLNHIVPEHILHERYDVLLHLLKQSHYFLWKRIYQLLLNESAAMLITAELENIALYVLQQSCQHAYRHLWNSGQYPYRFLG